MMRIAIYTESPNDSKAVECLTGQLAKFNKHAPPRIHIIPKNSNLNQLKKTMRYYRKNFDCVIFLIDRDGTMAKRERQKNPSLLMKNIKGEVDNKEVFLVEVVQEIESWLLIDCLGIFCYYATTKYSKTYNENNCRNKVLSNDSFKSFVGKSQVGDTEKIVEAVPGAHNAKEHLANFSEDILRKLNPNIPLKNVRREKYSPTISHKIAAFICINKETLGRNNSLKHFGEVIANFK